jgi:hypothetical protein
VNSRPGRPGAKSTSPKPNTAKRSSANGTSKPSRGPKAYVTSVDPSMGVFQQKKPACTGTQPAKYFHRAQGTTITLNWLASNSAG